MTAWASSAGGDWDLSGLLRGLFGEQDSERGGRRPGERGGPCGAGSHRSESKHGGPWGDASFGDEQADIPFRGAPFDQPWGRRGDWGRDFGKEFGRMFSGFGSWGGPPWVREKRRARGDVRSAVLALLAEEPMHGYQMIQEIGRRSGGSWKASPGSVYPTLQQLEDEGLVRADEQEGRRVYRLTDAGRQEATERAAEFADLWQGVAPKRDDSQLAELVFGVGAAFVHVAKAGNAEQMAQAREVLARTRADLYRILGENPDGSTASDAEDGTDNKTADSDTANDDNSDNGADDNPSSFDDVKEQDR
ncbi:PadR family transcriptional regulator [Nakamurella lactea]|uniref:PadR family transcriptional regulator n=1 Tax=Nakamurella lactea TaxID=459515 RepID=UPI0006857145|nr:PadR family transcriptional regulator [Nakamurella lactea]